MTAEPTQDLALSSPPPLDEDELTRLLALAGPSDARELMRRLLSDIAGVKAGMVVGLQLEDRQAMRRHSHVLIALAGTIGARRVHELAELLNLCARDESCGSGRSYADEILLRLDGLMLRLRAMAAELGISVNAVYLAKSRVLQRLRRELEGFLE